MNYAEGARRAVTPGGGRDPRFQYPKAAVAAPPGR